MLHTYMSQLEEACNRYKVRLLDAYLAAGFPDSTYYRHRCGQHDISESVAGQVMVKIRELAADKKTGKGASDARRVA